MFSSPTQLHGLAIPPSTIDVPAADVTSNARPGNGVSQPSLGSAFDSISSVRIAPGTVIANYEVIRQIGAGGMGRVFEVWHPTLQKSFALKLLTEHLEQDRAALERFQSETLAIAQLDHPNVVSGIDAGTWQGRPFLVTPFLQGSDLETHVALHGPLSRDMVSRLALQIARGMQAAHSKNYIHRDIKPSNLFLEDNGNVRLLDFGLVRSDRRDSLTKAGSFFGSLDYLAPEQASDPRAADARSDIYSLGCTLIFLLSGRPPYPDADFPSLPAKLLAHGQKSPAWLDEQFALRSDPLLTLVRRMIAKCPAHRPPSAAEIIESLEAMVVTRPTSSSAPSIHQPSRGRLATITAVFCGLAALGFTSVGLLRPWNSATVPQTETGDQTPTGGTEPVIAIVSPAVAEFETDKNQQSTTAFTDVEPTGSSPIEFKPDRHSVQTLSGAKTHSAAGASLPTSLMGLPQTGPNKTTHRNPEPSK